MTPRVAAIGVAVALIGCAQNSPRFGPPTPVEPMALGLRLMRAGETEMALGAFNRAIAEDGLQADALTGVGAALHRLGQPEEATLITRSAVDLDPNLAVARNNLGVMLYEQGDYAGALSEFERAYALTNGVEGDIATNLGIAEYMALRRIEAATLSDDADFDLVQLGHGVYRLEPRKRPAEDPT